MDESLQKQKKETNQLWLRFHLPVTGVDLDEAAGLLAYDLDETVRIDESLSLLEAWVPETEDSRAIVFDAASRLQTAFPDAIIGEPTMAWQEDEDWLALWKEHFVPLPVGERLLIVPPWHAEEGEAGRIRLIIDPGMAFGTGHHPATLGCLRYIEQLAPGSLLDVGCGTGILGIGAALMDAKRVVGVDTDPVAVTVARENLLVNNMADRVAILDGDILVVTERFDTIVANLTLNPLMGLPIQFSDRLEAGGRLIISGLLDEQATTASGAMTGVGFCPVDSLSIDGWTTLTFDKRCCE